jgi:probable phosphoglycerate mutase
MTDAGAATLRLYLVRHGETAWTLTHQHTGRTDIALTDHGETQARALAPWLRRVTFAHVFSSPSRRAVRTCELAGLGDAAVHEPELMEWDYGDYEGRLSTDIRKERPGWNTFIDGCPGGESPANVASRADRLIGRLNKLRGNVALFSHGEFGSALAARWLELPVAIGAHLLLDTASLSILGENRSHPELRALILWNAVPEELASASF